jgi:acyl carrier protein
VADEATGAPVAAGSTSVGEVLIRGPTTFEGYLHNPQATADAFTDAGWFRTGDLASVRPDGYICVVDRKKDMILCGGENVYCSEVEAVLISHPAVAQVAVFGVPNVVLGELVAAAVVLKTPEQQQQAAAGASSSSSGSILAAAASPAEVQRQLTEWCRERLAHYKVPTQVHVVDAMPVTGSGKILKTELRQRFAAAPVRPTIAPAGPPPSPAQAPLLQQSGSSAAAMSVQELAARAAAALATGPAVLDLGDGSTVLSSGTSYVLPVADSFSSVVQQVQAAVSKGARHLLLLATTEPPALALSSLEPVLRAHAAQAVVVLVDAAVAGQPNLLAFSLFDAAQGMPAAFAVLQMGPAQAQLAVAGISTAQLASAAGAALAVPTAPLAAGQTPLSSSSTYVLVLLDSMPLQQQVQAAVSAGARNLVLLAGSEPSAAVLAVLELELRAAGATATFALVEAATAGSSRALAYALLDATAGIPPVAAVLLPAAAAPAPATGPAQPIAAAASAAPTAADPAAGEAAMAQLIKSAISDLIGAAAASSISMDDPLMSSGINSTAAVALTTQLEASLGTSLPPTLVFDYVTIKDLSSYLASTVAGTTEPATDAASSTPAALAGPLWAVPAAAAAAPGGETPAAFVAAAVTASPAGASAAAVQLVTAAVQELLGGDAGAALDPSAPLMSVGLNSTMAVALASTLEAAVGSPVPPTVVSREQSAVAGGDQAQLMPLFGFTAEIGTLCMPGTGSNVLHDGRGVACFGFPVCALHYRHGMTE